MTTTVLAPTMGRDALPYVDASQPNRPLVVHTYRPAAHGAEDPVVIVQHGMLRNGDEYRDFWIDAAERHRILIAAPTFADAAYPKAESYNNGMVIAPDGVVTPRASWIYGVPARVLAALRAGGVTRRARVQIFGHSAGAQFVHRLLATEVDPPFDMAAPANAGWYTLPTLERQFPAGLGGLGLDSDDLRRFLAYPMTLFAGDRDIDTSDPNLPGQPEALAQGPTRFARAQFFYDFARRQAESLGVAFGWRLIVVPGIGHDGRSMSRAVASFWFEDRIPSPEELQVGTGQVA